jgi:hypothetical protein
MTRRAVLCLLLLSLALAAFCPAQSTVAIQWHKIEVINPADLPATSGAQSKYGILAEVFSDNHNAEGYVVTLRYWRPSTANFVEQTKIVLRCRDAVADTWTPVAFYTGEPVQVVEIKARELVASGAEGTVRG